MTSKNLILSENVSTKPAFSEIGQPHIRRFESTKTSFEQILKNRQASKLNNNHELTSKITHTKSQNLDANGQAKKTTTQLAAKHRYPISLSHNSRGASHGIVTPSQAKRAYQAINRQHSPLSKTNILTLHTPGRISAYFESSLNGPGTIGFDPMAGTSYGTYQIASRPGTMNEFIQYLAEKAPQYAARLKQAGPVNTGGKTGRMPDVWQRIAAEDPVGFERLQRDFIEQTHYLPACQAIKERTGFDVKAQPLALREAVFSTSVQHGAQGAANIFEKALKNRKTTSPQAVIQTAYAERMKCFRSSPIDVRRAVAVRLAQERGVIMSAMRQGHYRADRNNPFET